MYNTKIDMDALVPEYENYVTFPSNLEIGDSDNYNAAMTRKKFDKLTKEYETRIKIKLEKVNKILNFLDVLTQLTFINFDNNYPFIDMEDYKWVDVTDQYEGMYIRNGEFGKYNYQSIQLHEHMYYLGNTYSSHDLENRGWIWIWNSGGSVNRTELRDIKDTLTSGPSNNGAHEPSHFGVTVKRLVKVTKNETRS